MDSERFPISLTKASRYHSNQTFLSPSLQYWSRVSSLNPSNSSRWTPCEPCYESVRVPCQMKRVIRKQPRSLGLHRTGLATSSHCCQLLQHGRSSGNYYTMPISTSI